MSSFTEVRDATCRVLTDDGKALEGTAFCILDGVLLTAHHVVFGLRRILIRCNGRNDIVEATYDAALSQPAADIAVLRVPAGSLRPVQVARVREGTDVYGYGYRPSTLGQEPDGHTFSGRLGPGQTLRTPVSASARATIAALAPAERGAWNAFDQPFRDERVCNLENAKGLEGGISGGPIYDSGLRKVIGLFRAVENGEVGYVIPLDAALAGWPNLIAENAAGVPDAALDELYRSFAIKLVSEGARPQVPVLRRNFDALLARHALFGGRERELAKLAEFPHDASRTYYFLSAPAGFGKSALLANFVASCKRAGTSTVYHFFSKIVEGSLSAEYFFTNVCEQLMDFHGVGGDMPGAASLPQLFRLLVRLEPPPGRDVVIVIDGLDEPLGTWSPGPELFVADLSPGVHVVFSARDIADRDWPASLGLHLEERDRLNLGALDRAGIGDVLATLPAGTISPDVVSALTDRLWELSTGDVFYLRDLLDDLQKSNAYTPASLAARPVGHIEYLKAWWRDADASDKGFKDLMGLLVVAREALTKSELSAIAPDDELDEWTIDSKIAKAVRYIVGDETAGYRLSHTRIVEFISARLGASLALYRTRVAQYCEGWQTAQLDDHARRYVLRNAARHIADAGRIDALFALLDGPWFAATWREHGSYVGLIDDLGVAASCAYAPDPPDFGRIAGAAVARATARTLLSTTSVETLAATARLGDGDRVIAMMQAERSGTRAPGALPAIAVELLRAPATPIGSVRRGVQQDFALSLLQRDLAAVSTRFELAAYRVVLETLARVSDLDDARILAFVERLHADAVAHPREPSVQSIILGNLAKAAAAHSSAVGLELLAQADAVAWGLSAEERCAIDAFLLWPRGALTQIDVVAALQPLADGAADPVTDSELEGWPLLLAVSTLPWHELADRRGEAADLLAGMFTRAGRGGRMTIPVAAIFMRAIWNLGAVDEAELLLQALSEQDPALAAAAIVESAKEIRAAGEETFVQWMSRAERDLDPLVAAKGWGSGGEWERALDALARAGTGDPRERSRNVELYVAVFKLFDGAPPAGAVLPIAQRLLELAEGAADDASPILAAAACAVSDREPVAARAYLDRAVALELGSFPNGDVNDMRRFVSIASAQTHDVATALDALSAMPFGPARCDAIAEFVSAFPPDPADDAALTRVLGSTAQVREYLVFLDAFMALLRLEDTLRDHCPRFMPAISDDVARWANFWLLKTKAFFQLFAREPALLTNHRWAEFASYVKLTSRLAVRGFDDAAAALEELRESAGRWSPRIRCNLELLREIASAEDERSGRSSAEMLRAALEACLRNKMLSADARAWFTIELHLCGRAVELLGRSAPQEAAAVLGIFLDHCLAPPEGWARAGAMVLFWSYAARCDAAAAVLMNAGFESALGRYGGPFGQDIWLDTVVCMLTALCNAGNDARADKLVDSVAKESDRSFARGMLQLLKVRRQLAPATPLERVYLEHGGETGFPQITLDQLHAGEAPDKTITTFTRALVNELVVSDREGVIDANVWPLLLPLYQKYGVSPIVEMVESITSFDARFHDATNVLRRGSAMV